MLSKFTVAALSFAVSTEALTLNLGLEAELPTSCLVKSEQVITLPGEHAGESTIDNFEYLIDEAIDEDYHFAGLEVCLEEPESHDDLEHRAIIGFQVTL